jgi:Fe2+ transport system protein FeoA
VTAPPSTLADAPRGGRLRVVAVDGPAPVVQRLLEMGLTEGTDVEVVRSAPLGDPLEVSVRGYRLSVRKDDARCVRVADPRASR